MSAARITATIPATNMKVDECAVVRTQWQPFDGKVIDSNQHSNGNIDIIGKFLSFFRPSVIQQIIYPNGYQCQCRPCMPENDKQYTCCNQTTIPDFTDFLCIKTDIEKNMHQCWQYHNTKNEMQISGQMFL